MYNMFNGVDPIWSKTVEMSFRLLSQKTWSLYICLLLNGKRMTNNESQYMVEWILYVYAGCKRIVAECAWDAKTEIILQSDLVYKRRKEKYICDRPQADLKPHQPHTDTCIVCAMRNYVTECACYSVQLDLDPNVC